MKKFTPFKSFDWTGRRKDKSLHDTMQDSPSRDFIREEKCKPNCVPLWEETGVIRCGDRHQNTIVEVEEANGCGDTRWFRKEMVYWTRSEEFTCDIKSDRRLYEEMNQCGDIRHHEGEYLTWVQPEDSEIRCTDKKVQHQEFNECGDTRWVNGPHDVKWQATGNFKCLANDAIEIEEFNQCGETRWRVSGSVQWASTGQTRCVADKLELQEINQCGSTRWTPTGDPCPCVPNWVATGQTRCTGTYVEEREDDGCGNIRWVATTTPVDWFPTGQTRCGSNYREEIEEENSCGSKRWKETSVACGESIDLRGIGQVYGCCALVGTEASFLLSMSNNGNFSTAFSCWPGSSGRWLNGVNSDQYEVMFEPIGSAPPTVDSDPVNTWISLGQSRFWDYTVSVNHGMPTGLIIRYKVHVRRASDHSQTWSSSEGYAEIRINEECM